jgi:CheY-like chemotaxis protein
MHYVLVVGNDDEEISFIEEAFLAQPGNFSIKTFLSANLLLDHLRRVERKDFPSLIIVNNYLPDMDGLALLEKIKEDPFYKLIPVAIMAGFASANTIKQYYLAGANCFYKKPLDKDEWNHMADCLITLFCRG